MKKIVINKVMALAIALAAFGCDAAALPQRQTVAPSAQDQSSQQQAPPEKKKSGIAKKLLGFGAGAAAIGGTGYLIKTKMSPSKSKSKPKEKGEGSKEGIEKSVKKEEE